MPTVIPKRKLAFKRAPQFYRIKLFMRTPTFYVIILTVLSLIIRLWQITAIKSLMFDEGYYVLRAISFAEGKFNLPTTHPPLASLIIAVAIKIFGNNWFSYRFLSTLFGTALIPIGYLIGRELKSHTVGLFCALILSLDGMLFIYSRTGQAEIFYLFFIFLTFYLFLKYLRLKKSYLLIAVGISLGLAASIKYAAFSLLLILLIAAIQNRNFYKKDYIKAGLFLFSIPVIIYLLFFVYLFRQNVFHNIIPWHINSLSINMSKPSSFHLYNSPWWSWFPLLRSVWFNYQVLPGKFAGINLYGNPVIWWSILVVLPFMIRDAIRKDKNSIIILSGFIVFLLPFIFIEQFTFIYHALPSFVFLVFGLALYLERLLSYKYGLTIVLIYFCLMISIYIYMFPLWVGLPLDYVNFYTRLWLKGWWPKYCFTDPKRGTESCWVISKAANQILYRASAAIR